MWVQAGFEPDSFWQQTPATFQACMTGVRDRLEQQQDNDTALAWQMAAFNAGTKAKGGLKPLRHYLRPKPQTADQMLTLIKAMGAGSNMQIKRTGG